MHVLEVHPKERRTEAEHIFGEMFAGRLASCPLPLASKAGQHIPVETRVWFGKWDGNDCIFGISKDLSYEQAAFDKFHKLFNNNPALMAVSNITDRKFIDVNNAFVEKLGYTRDEIIGKTAKDLGLFIEADKQVEASKELQKTGRIKDIELQVRKSNGQIMFGLFSGELIDNQMEKSFLTVMTDITYMKKLEVEITRISERLKLATKAANVGVWEYDIETNTLIWDEAMYQLYGMTSGHFTGAYDAWEKGLHPEDLVTIRGHFQEAIANVRDFDPEFRVVWQDGSIHYIKANAIVMKDAKGKPCKMYGTNWDITEHYLREEQSSYQIQMQNILMNIASQYINIPLDQVSQTIQQSLKELGQFVKADRSYIFDYDWDKNTCSNTYEWCEYGVTAQIEELQDVDLNMIPQWAEAHRSGEMMHIGDVLALPTEDGVRQILESQDIKSIITIPMMLEDQCVGFVGFDSVKSYHQYSENEKKLLVLFAGMLININSRSILEKNMSDAKVQAEAANIAKSQFLANMSHEIRTPMNGIVGFLELLKTSQLSLEQKEFIREAKSASEVLLYIINDILDFSKIEAGKLSMEKIPFDLRMTVEDAVSLVAPKAAEKQIDLNAMIQSNVPEEVMGDPSRVRQILNNLLSNAIKFTEKGDINIEVSCNEIDQDMAKLQFKVKDTGIGISEEAMRHLFQSFNQADASTTRKYGGTGLGLAISKELVKLMDGQMQVESIEGKGSTFSFYIVLKISKKAVEQKYDFGKLENKNILIVDDQTNNRQIMSAYLQGTGLNIYEAKDAGAAIALIFNQANTPNKIHVAIIDYQMPGMSGYELASALKNMEIGQDISMILLTSAAQKGDGTAAQAIGFAGYLTKPVRRDDLVDCIAIVLGLKNANKEQVVTTYTIKEAKNAQKPKILLVEDNEMNRKIVVMMLKSHDMTCDIAVDGREAYLAVRKKAYDLVFMDCQMPVMDGYESTSQIRNDEGSTKHTLIVAMTANAMEGDKERCIAAGMDGYISKPIDFDHMFQIIEQTTLNKEVLWDQYDIVDENIQRFQMSTGMQEAFAKEVFKEYIQYLPILLNDISVAINAIHFDEIQQLAHQLKGSSGTLRINSIYELALELEQAAKQQEIEACKSLFIQLKGMFH